MRYINTGKQMDEIRATINLLDRRIEARRDSEEARACMMAEKRRLQAAWDELSAQNKEVAA